MKRILFSFCLISACSLIACGDDSSSGPKQDDETSIETSSSQEKSSSSSEKATSSSSSSDEEEHSSSSMKFPANYDPETKTLTDERDGEVYKTVLINNQIWMAENLRYMPEGPVEGCDERYTHEEDLDSVATFGRHYAWVDAMILPCDSILSASRTDKPTIKEPHQGICPDGWHVTSPNEWIRLIDSVNILDLLSTEWIIADQQGTDLYGFNLQHRNDDIIIGYITTSGEFGDIDFAGFYDNSLLPRAFQVNLSGMTLAKFYLRCIMD